MSCVDERMTVDETESVAENNVDSWSDVERDREDSASETDEEDVWIKEQIERDELERATQIADPDGYKPQLMDAHEMTLLRRALKHGEVRLQQDGRLREFVPRRPASNRMRRPHAPPASVRPATTTAVRAVDGWGDVDENHHRSMRTPPPGALEPLPPVPASPPKRMLYAKALRREMHELKELELRYEDTKRALLEHLDVVCSTKPNERMSSSDVYERLHDLEAFARSCTGSSWSLHER
ncbi:TPA: hypothetical protein N0F65_012495 [Lagenidium giganteum]|uniref:Uncharacterized protein n=1 Tax=Lagenidium giganteum TaxID=4803 RepID=A0AAV2YSR9_9STRA|nr:TPA: hypothetical protein N0F65_012495 [Lagenidium giganteum]